MDMQILSLVLDEIMKMLQGTGSAVPTHQGMSFYILGKSLQYNCVYEAPKLSVSLTSSLLLSFIGQTHSGICLKGRNSENSNQGKNKSMNLFHLPLPTPSLKNNEMAIYRVSTTQEPSESLHSHHCPPSLSHMQISIFILPGIMY